MQKDNEAQHHIPFNSINFTTLTGSKELILLIVKMIQNLEIKMETQINSLETRIEKMQERLFVFNTLISPYFEYNFALSLQV